MTAPTYYGRELPVRARNEMSQQVVDAGKAIHAVVNIFDESQAHDLAYLLASDHRTLVQNVMRDLVMPFILWLAADHDEGRYDARNEGACQLAADLREAFDKADVRLPSI
jgi:hypothetical protein